VRVQLSTALMGVCTQQLLPTRDGRGRVVACEILVPTPAVRHNIREGTTHQLPNAIITGSKYGMQTLDAALADLVRGGSITRELALNRCSSPDTFARLLEQGRQGA
jgi:twitching motility protein PilT